MGVSFLAERIHKNVFGDKISLVKRIFSGSEARLAELGLKPVRNNAEPGGSLSGQIKISGGSINYFVEQVLLNIYLDYEITEQDSIKTGSQLVVRQKIMDAMLLEANSEGLALPYNVKLPYGIPASGSKTTYRMVVELDLNDTATQKETIAINVLPNTYTKMFFDALTMLGFRELANGGDYINRFQRFKFAAPESSGAQGMVLFMLAGEKELQVRMAVSKNGETRGPASFNLPYARLHNSEQLMSILEEIIKEL